MWWTSTNAPVPGRAALAALAFLAVVGCKSKAREATPAPADDAAVAATDPGKSGTTRRPGDAELHRDHGHADEHPRVPCPIADRTDPDAALDESARTYDRGDFAVSYACSELATDLVPQAVEAHHMRAAALAALERFDEAATAFAMAVVLDPDDPETLAAAADFHINAQLPKRRDTTLLGLAYARRGSDKASSRRSRDRELRARLSLLEAQALNDVGRSDEALPRIDETLRLVPDSVAARYERGVSLFNLCQFDRAYTEFAAVLKAEPDDPYAHHHLGLIYERKGRVEEATRHFTQARSLAPDDFPPPVLIPPAEFRAEVDAAVAQLPADVRAALTEVAIEVVDLPAIEDLTAVDPPFAPTILGLYRGLPAGMVAEPGTPPPPPRAIVLYRKNLARAVKSREELDLQIARTVEHEVGHLHGLDEGELRRRGLE